MSSDSDRHHFYKPKRASVISLTGFSENQAPAPTLVEASKHPIIAAVECGSASFVVTICEVSDKGDTVLHRQEFDASAPSKTVAECTQFLTKYKPADIGYHALGILSASPTSDWDNVDLLEALKGACQGSLPLKIKKETTSAVGLAQDAFTGEDSIETMKMKTFAAGALAGGVVTMLLVVLMPKKK